MQIGLEPSNGIICFYRTKRFCSMKMFLHVLTNRISHVFVRQIRTGLTLETIASVIDERVELKLLEDCTDSN